MAAQQTLLGIEDDTAHNQEIIITERYAPDSAATLYHGDCLDLIASLPDESAQLIVTSPPYNIGKKYEKKRLTLDDYIAGQKRTIDDCVRALAPGGSICWQVGNHVDNGEVFPLDILLYPIFKAHKDRTYAVERRFEPKPRLIRAQLRKS